MVAKCFDQTQNRSRELVRRLREHQPYAIAELYDDYGALLFAAVVRIVHDPLLAEDLVQESFLRAWNRSQQLTTDSISLGPWMLAIARHCALDYLKSQAHLSGISSTDGEALHSNRSFATVTSAH